MRRSFTSIIKGWFSSARKALRTQRGRNVVLYAVCLVVAFLFWVMMTLDEPTERDYHIRCQLVNVPDSIVVVDDLPPYLSVVVKGKGTQFVRKDVLGLPVMELDFRQYSNNNGYITLSRAKLDSKLRELFGGGVTILAVVPDTLRLGFTSGAGYKLPLKVNADVTTSSHSVISGPIRAALDSVRVYTVGNIRPHIEYVETQTISCHDISDTTRVNVGMKRIAGVRVVPETVEVTIPVELLVSKKVSLPVRVENLPENTRMITYPSTIEVSYLVPMRLSNHTINARAVIDYNNANASTRFAPVSIESPKGGYRMVSVSQDSVEYVIER